MKTIEHPIIYPESDGKPMADNTEQYHWITYLKSNLDVVFAENPAVFVAGDLLWYPVKDDSKAKVAPDVMVAFGPTKGDRSSYLQWQEGNVAPQVVFEVISPSNHPLEMSKKLSFYEKHGVEEYYAYDPQTFEWAAWQRNSEWLRLIEEPEVRNWVSPRLGVRFQLEPNQELRVFRPDGQPFKTLLQLENEKNEALQRAERLAAKLRELGLNPDAL